MVAATIWVSALRAPFFNLFAGPLNGGLLGIAAIAGLPGGRGPRSQRSSLALYVGTMVVALLVTSAGLVPWLDEPPRPVRHVLLGVHGEGIPGLLGVVVGAFFALLAPRGPRSAG
jgi:hypothetical protein